MASSWKGMPDLKTLRRWMDRDAVLDRLGLEEKSPASDFFGGLGLFSIGILVGAGLGILFAPRRGEEVRQSLGEAWRSRGGKEWERDLGAEHAVRPPQGA